jgi:hypothetical protein
MIQKGEWGAGDRLGQLVHYKLTDRVTVLASHAQGSWVN